MELCIADVAEIVGNMVSHNWINPRECRRVLRHQQTEDCAQRERIKMIVALSLLFRRRSKKSGTVVYLANLAQSIVIACNRRRQLRRF